jgi:hypothetical protein
MTETLGQKRDRFTRDFARWIIAVNEVPGYTLRVCEVLRSDEQAEIHALGAEGRSGLVAYLMPRYPELAKRIGNNTGSGIRNSLHCDGLAGDAQLFVNGEWVTGSNDPRWVKVGEMWEAFGPDYRWGGRFGDACHVSIEHQGRK